MPSAVPKPFQVLALSGGGFRGLYTAKVIADVAAVASINLKADEPGLLELARWQGWTIHFYPAAELAAVPVPHPSETVRKYTGTPSVSEAAALLAAGVGMDQLIIEKLKYRGPDGRNATVSIARIPQ